jgi:hypothetical protein
MLQQLQSIQIQDVGVLRQMEVHFVLLGAVNLCVKPEMGFEIGGRVFKPLLPDWCLGIIDG